MYERLKAILLYGGTEKAVYDKIYGDITEGNRRNMEVFTMLTAVGLLCMTGVTFIRTALAGSRLIYALAALVSAILLLVIRKPAKDHPRLVYVCIYIFTGMLFAFGIVLGTVINVTQLTVTFMIMLFAVPLLFTDRPLRMDLAILAGITIYCLIAHVRQDSIIFASNMDNIVPYGILSLVVSSYMMMIKTRRYVLEHENKFLSESDQMTGMLNRRSYEQHMSLLRQNGCSAGTKICALDINGLKMVNDNLGHHAGDELIRGAADCIRGVFGPYGKCYRTGGDEFVAILEGASPEETELKDMLTDRCACFKGAYVSGLSISIGIAEAEEGDIADELVKKADWAMYAFKADYYKRSGIDRRRAR